MGDVIPFPEKFGASDVARLKRENCTVRFDLIVDPEVALELLIALGRLDISIQRHSISIIRPDGSAK